LKKIAIIGFGAAAIGFIKGLTDSGKIKEYKIDIYERGKDIENSGFGGLKYDGKIFVSRDMGGDLEIPLTTQKDIVNFYLEKSGLAEKISDKEYKYSESIEKGNSFEDYNLYKKFYDMGFEPIKSDFYHIGTDLLVETVSRIYEEYESNKNINFIFSEKVTEVIQENRKAIVVTNDMKKAYDSVVVAVGRGGHGLVKNIIKDNPDFILSNNKVDLGVRFELPDHIVDELNKKMYEFKIKLKTKTGYTVRTFCNNPSGEVTLEKYDDFVTVNGHANSRNKSKNTNFAILVSHSFTEPFNDPVGYGSYIAKLSNILAGGRKVIVQAYEDFAMAKRTKRLGRVEPTLSKENYILGDLNLVFPRKTVESIIDFMEKLNKVVPGITYPDNLLYGVEVKFYSNKINNSYFDNIKVIGDASGWTRSITYASCHGYILSSEY